MMRKRLYSHAMVEMCCNFLLSRGLQQSSRSKGMFSLPYFPCMYLVNVLLVMPSRYVSHMLVHEHGKNGLSAEREPTYMYIGFTLLMPLRHHGGSSPTPRPAQPATRNPPARPPQASANELLLRRWITFACYAFVCITGTTSHRKNSGHLLSWSSTSNTVPPACSLPTTPAPCGTTRTTTLMAPSSEEEARTAIYRVQVSVCGIA